MTENEETDTIQRDEFEHIMDVRLKAALAILGGMLGCIFVAWLLGVPLGSAMANIQGTFFYHFIPFLISVSFFAVLVYRAYVQQIKGLGYLTTAVLLHGISELLASISDPTGTILNRDGNTLAMIADLLFPIAVVLLYLHIELTDKIRPNLVHAIGIGGTAAPLIIGGALITILENLNLEFLGPFLEELRKVVLVYLGLFALIILWISLFAFKVMYGTLKHADSPEVARSSNLVLVAFSSMLANFLLLGITYSTVLIEDTILLQGVTIHNTWLVTFALITIILAYILSPSFSYAVPFDVYQLACIHSQYGVTLYSFVNEIRSPDGKVTHDALQSATIVAIQNLVQEIAAAEGNIMIIGMEDRVIVFRSMKELNTIIITERNSYFLNKGLQEFTKAFYEQFNEHITNFQGNVKVFNDAKKLVRKHLPFMRKESLT
ncbi:MAG: hypothetical protein ACXAE3_11975 [Candidatus Kariarchaeaceae archaeon]|jgi:hypothetical protein